jgi:hypothetical protein
MSFARQGMFPLEFRQTPAPATNERMTYGDASIANEKVSHDLGVPSEDTQVGSSASNCTKRKAYQ